MPKLSTTTKTTLIISNINIRIKTTKGKVPSTLQNTLYYVKYKHNQYTLNIQKNNIYYTHPQHEHNSKHKPHPKIKLHFTYESHPNNGSLTEYRLYTKQGPPQKPIYHPTTKLHQKLRYQPK